MRKTNSLTARAFLFALIVLPLFLTCCSARRDTIILLPDASGKTGTLTVYTEGKEVSLDRSREAVTVWGGLPPCEPLVISEKKVESLVGPALTAHPPPPKQYLLYFDLDSFEINEESMVLFAEILKTINDNPPMHISVDGHSDTVGDHDYNFKLSCKRATMVANLLKEQGVDSAIIHTRCFGKQFPIVNTNDQVREQRNRRTEVTIR